MGTSFFLYFCVSESLWCWYHCFEIKCLHWQPELSWADKNITSRTQIPSELWGAQNEKIHIDVEGTCLKRLVRMQMKETHFYWLTLRLKWWFGGSSSGTEWVNFPSFIIVKWTGKTMRHTRSYFHFLFSFCLWSSISQLRGHWAYIGKWNFKDGLNPVHLLSYNTIHESFKKPTFLNSGAEFKPFVDAFLELLQVFFWLMLLDCVPFSSLTNKSPDLELQ